MESTLFKNAALLDPARPELLEDHDVLVENGLVKKSRTDRCRPRRRASST